MNPANGQQSEGRVTQFMRDLGMKQNVYWRAHTQPQTLAATKLTQDQGRAMAHITAASVDKWSPFCIDDETGGPGYYEWLKRKMGYEKVESARKVCWELRTKGLVEVDKKRKKIIYDPNAEPRQDSEKFDEGEEEAKETFCTEIFSSFVLAGLRKVAVKHLNKPEVSTFISSTVHGAESAHREQLAKLRAETAASMEAGLWKLAATDEALRADLLAMGFEAKDSGTGTFSSPPSDAPDEPVQTRSEFVQAKSASVPAAHPLCIREEKPEKKEGTARPSPSPISDEGEAGLGLAPPIPAPTVEPPRGESPAQPSPHLSKAEIRQYLSKFAAIVKHKAPSDEEVAEVTHALNECGVSLDLLTARIAAQREAGQFHPRGYMLFVRIIRQDLKPIAKGWKPEESEGGITIDRALEISSDPLRYSDEDCKQANEVLARRKKP